jgi:acetyltransferase-like isoleucine patch superfamily enzyme
MEEHLISRIDGEIYADEVVIGHGVTVEKDVVISGQKGKPARKIVLGDFCFIGRESRILTPEFRIGDYTKLNAYSYANGNKPLQIGRNCWFGGNVVLDSIGGLDIDDNVCVAAHSQVLTHHQFGDIVEGCRFYHRKYMHIEKDVWFGGHCIVSPVIAKERSMALAGSVITHDMLPNHIYAGVPARDITDKLGPQFETRTALQKAEKLEELITVFEGEYASYKGLVKVILSPDDTMPDKICFDVSTRTYTKKYHPAEVAFLKMFVPLIKFTPVGEPPFVVPKESLVTS